MTRYVMWVPEPDELSEYTILARQTYERYAQCWHTVQWCSVSSRGVSRGSDGTYPVVNDGQELIEIERTDFDGVWNAE